MGAYRRPAALPDRRRIRQKLTMALSCGIAVLLLVGCGSTLFLRTVTVHSRAESYTYGPLLEGGLGVARLQYGAEPECFPLEDELCAAIRKRHRELPVSGPREIVLGIPDTLMTFPPSEDLVELLGWTLGGSPRFLIFGALAEETLSQIPGLCGTAGCGEDEEPHMSSRSMTFEFRVVDISESRTVWSGAVKKKMTNSVCDDCDDDLSLGGLLASAIEEMIGLDDYPNYPPKEPVILRAFDEFVRTIPKP